MLDPKPIRRIKRREQRLDKEAARKFKAVGMCWMCGHWGDKNHHIVPQGKIREAGLGEDVRWDTRNRLTLCAACHDDHHSRKHPIPFSALPPSVLEFAAEHGFLPFIERTYPRA